MEIRLKPVTNTALLRVLAHGCAAPSLSQEGAASGGRGNAVPDEAPCFWTLFPQILAGLVASLHSVLVSNAPSPGASPLSHLEWSHLTPCDHSLFTFLLFGFIGLTSVCYVCTQCVCVWTWARARAWAVVVCLPPGFYLAWSCRSNTVGSSSLCL